MRPATRRPPCQRPGATASAFAGIVHRGPASAPPLIPVNAPSRQAGKTAYLFHENAGPLMSRGPAQMGDRTMSQPDQSYRPDEPPMSRGDWREARRRERHARRAERHAGMSGFAGPWLGGVVLVILGVGLLLQNIGYELPQRWWALLLLLPAVGSLVAAIRSYRVSGGTPDTIGALVGGAIFTALALALFFGVNWGIFWPLILVLLGIGLLLRSYWPR